MNHLFTKTLAIITTHPIQYNAPLFRYLSASAPFKIKVFYTWSQASGIIHDNDFGIAREWDIDLLSGYDYEFVENVSTRPGSHHFHGIINPSLVEKLELCNPDVILIYGWKFRSHLKLMQHFHGKVPILFRGDSTLLDESVGFSFQKFLRFSFLKWVYRHVDIALSPGKASDEYFKACGLKATQIVRAPHAVDSEFFSLDNEQKEKDAKEWRQQLGIPDEHKVFLYAGKLEPKKNPELLINAFFKLLKKRQDIHLIIVGSGILEKQLKILVSTLTNSNTFEHSRLYSQVSHLTSFVYFIPFQNQSRMPIVYRMADVFVLPSKGPGETWGLSVNEAMACSKPVIVSDVSGSAADLIDEGHNGFTFQSKNLESLLMKMELALGCDLNEMGKSARKKIEYFSYESFQDSIKSLKYLSGGLP